MHGFVDADEDELLRIYEQAMQHAQQQRLTADDIQPGEYYSNGRFDTEWSVRHVLRVHSSVPSAEVLYKIVAGPGRGCTGVASRAELAEWGRARVTRHEPVWRVVGREAG